MSATTIQEYSDLGFTRAWSFILSWTHYLSCSVMLHHVSQRALTYYVTNHVAYT